MARKLAKVVQKSTCLVTCYIYGWEQLPLAILSNNISRLEFLALVYDAQLPIFSVNFQDGNKRSHIVA
jgi:hypothetical protein